MHIKHSVKYIILFLNKILKYFLFKTIYIINFFNYINISLKL